MAVKAGSIYPEPAVVRSFEAPAGSEFVAVFVDGTNADCTVRVFLGQAATAVPLRVVAPGGSATFAIPASSSITFQVDPGAGAPGAGDSIYWGASTLPMSGVSTATRIIATIGNALLNVTGNISATIANASIAVTQVANAVFQIAGSVTVTNASFAITQLAGAVFNIAGNVTATIGNASIAITQAAGAIFNVQIQNATLAVTQAASAVFNVQGSINATIAASEVVLGVDPSKGGTGTMSVVNDVLPSNSLVFLGSKQATISNLAAGAQVNMYVGEATAPLGLYDGIALVLVSSGGLTNDYTLGNKGCTIGAAPNAPGLATYVYADPVPVPALPALNPVGPAAGSLVQLFAAPSMFNGAQIYATNSSGATIASDTLTVWLFAVKAQVSNPQANPAQIEAATGAFDTLGGANTGTVAGPTGSNSSVTETIQASGNYIKSITFQGASFTIDATSGSGSNMPISLTLYNGTQELLQVTGMQSGATVTTITLPAQQIDFGDGVPCNGILLVAAIGAAGTLAVTTSTIAWFPAPAILASTTPPQEVSVVS